MKLNDLKMMADALVHTQNPKTQQEIYEILRAQGMEPGSFYQELEMSSRYADMHRDVSDSNAAVSLHSHSFYEILYCCNTCAAEYLMGSERYRLRKGDVIIVPPGVSHRPLLPGEMEIPYQRYVLWVNAEHVNQLIQQFPCSGLEMISRTGLLRTEGTKWESIGAMFRRGVEESERKKPGWEVMVVSNAMQIVMHICRALAEFGISSPQAEKPELLDQVLAYIESHLNEKITLPDVAKRFWVSQSTITQTFRNKMGVSFYRCVTQRRLIAAKTMIAEGIPLEQVALEVGFSDYSSFYRAFKQEYGISPRQYRKLQDGSNNMADGMPAV